MSNGQRSRIVHLASGDLWAGAEVATFHLACAQAQLSDLSVRVVTLNEGELVERLRAAGVDAVVHDESVHGFAELSKRLRSELAEADLVHAHRYKENLLAMRSGRPWVATHHGLPEPEFGLAALRGRAYIALDLMAKRFSARRVIAVSQDVADWLAPRVGRTKVVQISNGIGDPAPVVDPREWHTRPQRLGVLGRLYPVKGMELAVEAVAAVPGLELEIVGEGPERRSLEALIARHGVADRIRLVGHDPNPLPRVAKWRALLVTSHHEGNPISVLEALALGTPVVTGPLAGVEAILQGHGGFVCENRDPATWSRLLTAEGDFWSRGGEKAREARAIYEDRLSADRAAEAVARVYREVLGRG